MSTPLPSPRLARQAKWWTQEQKKINDAKVLDKRIRTMVTSISGHMDTLAGLIAEAKTGEIHLALGFKSWTSYLADVAEIGWQNRDDRRKIVALLSGEGMSQRAIASATGVSQKTVDRDLDELSHDDSVDAEVISLDGKRRPKHPKPKPDVDVEAFSRQMRESAVRSACSLVDMLADMSEEFCGDERIGDAVVQLVEIVAANLTREQWNRMAMAAPPQHQQEIED